jgi:hypothetical protein
VNYSLGGIVKTYPAHLLYVMRLKYVILGCLLVPICSLASSDAVPPGVMQGHLRILAFKDVELAGENPPKFSAGNYAEYPLIILSYDERKEIARVTADEDGNFRATLPPGDYVLDVHDRRRRHVRATPQRFTVVSNQTVHLDMNIDTGIR